MTENTKKRRIRLDQLLIQRGHAGTRSHSRALIMSGSVYVNNSLTDKAGTLVDTESHITIRNAVRKYSSRGGLKLEAALKHFCVDTEGLVAADIGASTGGFTDCLLQHGVKKVYALDVGYGQLDWKLRNDSRVVVKERINCRYLKPDDIGETVDLVVVDVSFISLLKILKPAVNILDQRGSIITLIKPQFEVGKGEVGRGGIVKDPLKHRKVIDKVSAELITLGCRVIGITDSPITGADGNREFLAYSVRER